MAHSTTITITIDRPAERVWEQLMDPDNLQHWLTGFVSAEHISGAYGKAGSVSKLIFRENGRETEVTETATAVEAHSRYAFTMTGKAFDAETDIRLRPSGNRTELTQTVRFSPKQFFLKLLLPLMKSALKKRTKSELLRFKQFVETNA